MTPKQLMATGDWVRSGGWPYYQGEGPRYQHRTLDLRIQGYATHRNSRRRGGKGITKIRVWHLTVNGSVVWRDTRFAKLADCAAEYASGKNLLTGQPLFVRTLAEAANAT